VTRDELLDLLSRLRCAPIGRARLRAPHKPLLLLWLFGRFSAIGSTVATYAEAEEPVSALINEFGPRMASATAARRRAAMPFVQAVLGLAASTRMAPARRSLRRPGFAEEVLRAYAYQCAMCGFDGALGRNPVGIEAAHVRWHSQDGPAVVANGLALCALHHALFDLGAPERRIRVSGLYVARGDAGRAVDQLAGQALIAPRPGQPVVELDHIGWHHRQVFKGADAEAA
jgi:putative restriction endonuclease